MWEDATSCEAETKLCVVSSVFYIGNKAKTM